MVRLACRMLGPAAQLCLVFGLVGSPTAPDDIGQARNYSSLLQSDTSAYLHELSNYWPYNDTLHLSRFEEFDHTHFDDSHEATTQSVLARTGPPREKGPGDPVFDNNLVTNVTAQLSGTAFLRCRVRNLGERPVSWVRRRDWHILTSGPLTYTNDERFQVAHTAGGDDWTLQIKYVQKRDNGTYECQVATGSGTISHYFNLQVVVPSAFILGSGEYHIGEGSTISLVCIIENSPSPPQYVFWYHNDTMINYDTTRGGVTVSTEPGPKTHSRLIINDATRADSGDYTCRASNTEADTIHVFVSRGDNTAAIQRQKSSLAARYRLLTAVDATCSALLLWVLRHVILHATTPSTNPRKTAAQAHASPRGRERDLRVTSAPPERLADGMVVSTPPPRLGRGRPGGFASLEDRDDC